MRLKYARLKGYIGIYNGMDGLEELKIDFSRAKHKITIISGRNGSGKSTLEKALATPMPDNSSCFVQNMVGEKELHIVDENNLYELLMVSPISSNGTRGQTKAFVKKNGEELNSTGNITSYKDIIYTEFDLDPNYMTLCRISGDDRGIADKSPADRKRFVSVIISALETYNDMNKTLSKKSNIFKSYINNLDIKIKNIGDEQALYATQKDIDNRFKMLSESKLRLEKEKTEAESFISIIDPNNSLQDKYQLIYDGIKTINDSITEKEKQLVSLEASLHDVDKEHYKEELIKITDIIQKTEMKVSKAMDSIERLVKDREENLRDLDVKDQKIKNLENDFDINSLTESLQSLRKTVSHQESIFKDSQISNFNISRDDFALIFSSLQEIKQSIDVFKSMFKKEIMDKAIEIKQRGEESNVYSEIEESSREIDEAKLEIRSITMDIERCDSEISTMQVLEQRPKSCKIDTCPLIINAIDIKKQNPIKKKKELEIRKDYLEKLIIDKTDLVNRLLDIKMVLLELNKIIDNIARYRMVLDRVPVSVIFTDTEELLTRIMNGNTFNEISDVQKYVDLADDITDYRDNKENLIRLESEMKINKNKIAVIEDLKQEYQKSIEKIESIKDEIESCKKDKQFNEELLISFRKTESTLKTIVSIQDEMFDMRNKKESLKLEYTEIKDNISKIKGSIDKINMIASNLLQIEHDLEPIQDQKEQIRFSLATLESYKQELNMYKEKFNTVNILKKYSSPTAGGIQTLYMNIYMSKTLSMANEILSMIFNGEYRLQPYVINATEFRIPFVGNGLEVDDISSGSTSQVCMMGMVMNLVLLYQASTKYNIVFLDEPDGGLDSHNKYEFINVLYKMIDILGIDQLIMISHSIEMEMSSADIIRLKGYEEDEGINGNVIYQYGVD